ncbi:ESPR-type extended signal peptide-containing protein, partial [Psychrobacter pygoscelis]|uniref:ESPR-type extended signal peptide-containing protein n=1 Tax=Psychrobacter pygoscelis TaxID=2488563 RepID=UPI002418975C
MNHIYKVIFCKATGTFVAVAEYARAHGKKGGGTVGSIIESSESSQVTTGRYTVGLSGLTTLSAAVLLSLGLSTTAFAAADTCQELEIQTGNNIKCGSGTETDSGKSVAIGVNAKTTMDATNLDPTTGSGNNTAVGWGAEARGGNATSLGRESKALGGQSVAIGVDAVASASQSTAVGMTSKAYTANSTALGRGAQAGRQGSNEISATAIGSSAIAKFKDSVALGANSITTDVAPTNTGDQNDYRITGRPDAKAINATSVVSIGSAGSERRITNVAAGRINADSTDGVNGSQLYQTNELLLGGFELGQGDNGTKVADISPKERIDFINGTNTTAKVTADGTGANVAYNLNPDINITSVTTGNTRMNTSGIVINAANAAPNGLTPKNVILSNTGLDNGNQKIINVAPGTSDNDAVNVKQLNDKVASITTGSSATSSVVNGENTTVTSTTSGDNTAYKVNVNAQGVIDDAQLPVVYTDAAGNRVYAQTNPEGTITGYNTEQNGTGTPVETAGVITSVQSADGSTTKATKLSNVAAGTKATDAVNKGQLDRISTAGDTKTNILGSSTASNLGGGATYDSETGTVSAPSYS